MLFSSPIFLLFFLPIWLGVYALLPGIRARNGWLLVSSLGFYLWGEGTGLWVLLVLTAIGYYGAGWVTRGGRLSVVILAALLPLVVYKYTGFVAGTLGQKALASGWKQVAIPLGISFFTFQVISYLVDVARGRVQPARSLGEFALYLTFFPHLIAGPIVRFAKIRAQLVRRRFSVATVSRGLRIFTLGLAAKVLLANPLGTLADQVFTASLPQISTLQAWLGALSFTFQIYYDFHGYTLMAIGLAAMVGIGFPTNFNNPYQATSIADFWRRWHISLSRWLRDYVYRPLTARWGRNRAVAAIAVTFLVSGLWHGASWNFVIWGGYHGAFRIAERSDRYRRIFLAPWLARVWVFFVVLMGWVLFRIEEIGHAVQFWVLMLWGHLPHRPVLPLLYDNATLLTPDRVVVLVAATAFACYAPLARATHRLLQRYTAQPLLAAAVLTVLLTLSLAFMAAQTFTPFIYFKF